MQEQRQHPRLRVHWRIAVRPDEASILYGETIDISLGGACFLVDHNLSTTPLLQVFIQLPPKRQGQQAAIVSANAKVLYTAFSADHDRWRTGVQFVNFAGPERAKLEKELAQH